MKMYAFVMHICCLADHSELMMKSHFGGPQVVEQYKEKVRYTKNFSSSTLLVPASGKPVGDSQRTCYSGLQSRSRQERVQ